MSELELYKPKRGRPRGPKYEENKAKTDRKRIRKEEREQAGVLIPQPKRQKMDFSSGNLDSKLSRALKELIRKADDLSQRFGVAMTVLALPDSEDELPRVYSSNGQLMQNFMSFEMAKEAMRPDSLPPMLRREALYLIGHMEPIAPLALRRQARDAAIAAAVDSADFASQFMIDLPAETPAGPEIECLEPGVETPQRVEAARQPDNRAAFTMEITQTKMTLRGSLPIVNV